MLSLKTAGILLSFFCTLIDGQNSQQICPIGQYTKPKPSAEEGMKACKQYACGSCCYANLTSQLAVVPLQVVAGLNYSQCGGLSPICSQYMSYVQCFYQCSPNLYPWLGQGRRLYDLPLCASFCDEWYSACAYDRSCVEGTDWTKGFVAVQDPNDHSKKVLQCKAGQICRNFTEIYHDAEHFCTERWPSTVKYVKDESRCINPAGDPTEMDAAFHTLVGSDAPYTACAEVTYIDTGAVIGIVIGTLTGLALICGGVIFLLRRKAKKEEKQKAHQTKEMEELRPDTLE